MTKEEAKIYADNMTYTQAVYNALEAKSVPYKKATKAKLKELLKIAEDIDNFKEASKRFGLTGVLNNSPHITKGEFLRRSLKEMGLMLNTDIEAIFLGQEIVFVEAHLDTFPPYTVLEMKIDKKWFNTKISEDDRT